MKEKTLLEATLCFPCRGTQVLLARKTRNIGAGCWNGFGGGLKPGEKIWQATIRELWEESGGKAKPRGKYGLVAQPEGLKKIAVATFHNTTSDGSRFTCKVHVFQTYVWSGKAQSTNEMENPTWFDIHNLPLREMMLADPVWLPLVLNGQRLLVEASYGPFQKTLIGGVSIKPMRYLSPR